MTVFFTTTKQQREALKKSEEQVDCDGKRSKTQDTMNYPPVDDRAVDEYDTSIDIFGMAFPWLFLGGCGGPFDVRPKEKKICQWLEGCIYYEDGRFADDNSFTFYALNYLNMHKNASQGQYYVNHFNSQYKSLDDLQDAVNNNECG